MKNLLQRVCAPQISGFELTAEFSRVYLDAAKRLLRLEAQTVSRSFLEGIEGWGNLLAGQDPATLLQIYHRNLNTLYEAGTASAQILSEAQAELIALLRRQMSAYAGGNGGRPQAFEQSASAEPAAVLRAISSAAARGETVAQAIKRQA
jgi:hypothetical protein